jgi:protein-disulfide isomerase
VGSPKIEFVAKPSLAKGAEASQATLILTEFADFRCGHCKRASFTLHAFAKANPDVRFEFYSFPLDGACNEKIPQATGLSCRLASAVYCAEKDGKGWEMHDLIFAHQETINNFTTSAQIDGLLAKEISSTGLNWESVQRCIEQPETTDSIKSQAKQGALANVPGTPTVFANGRLVTRGSMLPVLQAIHEKAKASKSKN